MKLGGWQNLKFEDYWICFAVVCTRHLVPLPFIQHSLILTRHIRSGQVCYTGVIISVNEMAKNGSNYMSAETAASLTPKEVAMAIYGSKMTLVLELCQLTCLWSTKGCLVVLYYRLS